MMMKLTKGILGLALAGALTLCGASPAAAQNSPADPYYFTPKLLYSHTMYEDFSAHTSGWGGDLGKYKGTKKNDDTMGGGVAIGYDFGAYGEYPIRLELEYLYRGKTSADYGPRGKTNGNDAQYKLTSDIHTVFANAYLDFPTDTSFTPYVQAGLGGAYVDADFKGKRPLIFGNDSLSGSQADWGFAWNVGAGMAYQFSDTMAFDLGYRYTSFGDDISLGTSNHINVIDGSNGDILGSIKGSGKVKMSAHEVILGLRFTGF
jgi:outer membrane autotransporter protein